MTKVIALVGYARSGVTLLNRCLAADNRLVCLSEVNSRYVCPTEPSAPHEQLRQWYGIDIKPDTILEELKSSIICTENIGKTLVIRDWSFGSFTPLRYNNYQPTGTLNTVDDLKLITGKPVTTFALVRSPLDIWLSMRDSVKTFHDINLEYLEKYTIDILNRNIPIIKYEDLCKNPHETLAKIYGIIGIKAPMDINLSEKVIGDVNYPASSRGADKCEILNLPQRTLTDKDRLFLKENTKIDNINRLLSYPIEF